MFRSSCYRHWFSNTKNNPMSMCIWLFRWLLFGNQNNRTYLALDISRSLFQRLIMMLIDTIAMFCLAVGGVLCETMEIRMACEGVWSMHITETKILDHTRLSHMSINLHYLFYIYTAIWNFWNMSVYGCEQFNYHERILFSMHKTLH